MWFMDEVIPVFRSWCSYNWDGTTPVSSRARFNKVRPESQLLFFVIHLSITTFIQINWALMDLFSSRNLPSIMG